jgi:hypothetical protein
VIAHRIQFVDGPPEDMRPQPPAGLTARLPRAHSELTEQLRRMQDIYGLIRPSETAMTNATMMGGLTKKTPPRPMNSVQTPPRTTRRLPRLRWRLERFRVPCGGPGLPRTVR